MTAILFYGCRHVLTRQITYTSATEYCLDIFAIATDDLARSLEEVVFYFLARNLENEE